MQDFAAPTTQQAAPPAPVRVVARDGRILEGDQSQVAALLERVDPGTGEPLFTLDTPELAAERARQRTYGSAGAQVAAGAAGVARGATLGLSDAAAAGVDALAGTDITGDLNALREVNPGLSALGEVGGAVAPLLFTGGGSALARGAVEGAALANEARGGASVLGSLLRAGSAPARLAEGLAMGTEARTLAALGTEGSAALLPRVLGRAASMGAGGTVEGAALGVQQSITEAALGDAPLTAEQVIANVGLNALLGGATGGVLGSGAELLRSGARGSRDIIGRAFREATGLDLRRGVAEAWGQAADGVAAASSLATGADARAIREAIGPEGADLRSLVAQGDSLYEGAGREIREAMTTAEGGTRHVSDLWGRGMKRSQIRELVSTERLADQAAVAARHIDDVRAMAQRVLGDAERGVGFEASGIAGKARDLLRSVNAAEEIAARASNRTLRTEYADASADLFQALDELKRGIGDVQGRVERLDRGSSFLAELRGESGYEGIRRTLEADTLWGAGAAGAQRDVNRAFTRYLERRGRYAREFLGDGARDTVDPFRRLPEADSARVDSFVRSAGAARNDTRAQTFREVLDAQADLAETMARHLDLGDLAEDATKAAESARAARRTFDGLEERVARVNQFRALEQGSGIERTLLAQGAGFVAGGPLGAAIATALASPTVLARGLGAIERAAARVTQRIDSGASTFVRRALEAGRAKVARAARTASIAGRAAVVRTSVADFEREIQRVIEASANPQQTQERIARSTEEIGRSAPGVQQAMQAQAMRGLAFLAQRVPASARPTPLLANLTRRREPSVADRSRFMRYVRAVEDPLSVLEDMEHGSIPPESVEVLRELFPRLHQQMGDAFVRELTLRAREGDDVPFTFRRDLSALLGAPMDSAFSPAAIAQYQSAADDSAARADATERQQFGDPSGFSGASDVDMTSTARREQRRGG